MSAAAQSVSLVGAPAGNRYPAGPDFATDLLQDPWDFSNPADISPDPDEFGGWTQTGASRTIGTAAAFLSNGTFAATTLASGPAAGDSRMSLLYRGGYDLVNPGRSGLATPIPAAIYRKVAIRVAYGAGARGTAALYWFALPNGHPQDGAARGYAFLGAVAPGTRTFVLDLPAGWTGLGQIRGVWFDPTDVAATVDVAIDWVRVTAGDNDPAAARLTAAVVCGQVWTVAVQDGGGVQTAVASGSGNASAVVNYGIFPPGAYQLLLQCGGGSVAGSSFTISAPPQVTVVAPGVGSGQDFATATLPAGAWDMAQAADVDALANVNPAASRLQAAPGGGTELYAESLGAPTPGAGDPVVSLLGTTNNAVPIASAAYRYLTFTLAVGGSYDVGLGSVARLFWASASGSDASTNTTTQDIKVWPGRNTYTIDLGALSSAVDPVAGTSIETECLAGNPPCPLTPWAARSVRFLRLDPHEFPDARPFTLDDVQLRQTDDVAIGAPYTFRWQLTDPDSAAGQSTVRVYLDTDRDPSGFYRLAATRPGALVNTVDAVAWTPDASVPPGVYEVFIQAADGATGEVRGAYASSPLRILAANVSAPVITLFSPANGGSAFAPFSVVGCAADPSAGAGTGVDDVLVSLIGGPDVDPAQRGKTYVVGEGGPAGFGVKQLGQACPGGGPAGSGFTVSDLSALSAGSWTVRVLARSTATGRFTVSETSFTIDQRSGPAGNLRLLSAAGNTVTIAWDPPTAGRAVSAYRIEVALTPAFAPLIAQVPVPSSVTAGTGALPNGVYYVRVITESAYTNAGPSSNVLAFSLPGGGPVTPPAPPGAPTLAVRQVDAGTIRLDWAASAGGAPAQYVVVGGTTPGASNLGSFPMGLATGVTAAVPLGVPIYARVIAANAAGSAASNEVHIVLGAVAVPGVPVMAAPQVAGNTVTLSWAPGGGGPATGYTVVARLPGSGAVIASLPGLSGTAVSVPGVPPGTYIVSVYATNGAGPSGESAPVTVVVP